VRDAEQRTVPVAGGELTILRWPGDSPAAPVVLLLHGITSNALVWARVAGELAGEFEVVAPDLRGRAGSAGLPGPYGLAAHAEDVAAVLSRFGDAVVVGHSMGAFVATLAAAVATRYRVRGLVLVDGGLPLQAPAGIDPEQMLDIALAAQMARLRTTYASVDDYLAFWRGLAPFSGDRWNAWVEAYLTYDLGGQRPRLRPRASEEAVRGDFRDTLDGEALRSRLRSIDVPVTLLRAAEGFEPGQPPLFDEDVVRREGTHVRRLTDELVPDTSHYTIALGERGATIVADRIVAAAEAAGR